jgi:hypothetical protein
MIILADIQFRDGSIHRCTGKVRGGVPNESPGVSVPWRSADEVRDLVKAIEGLVLIRIITAAP